MAHRITAENIVGHVRDGWMSHLVTDEGFGLLMETGLLECSDAEISGALWALFIRKRIVPEMVGVYYVEDAEVAKSVKGVRDYFRSAV